MTINSDTPKTETSGPAKVASSAGKIRAAWLRALQRFRRAGIGILVCGAALAFLAAIGLLSQFETATLDWRYRNFNHQRKASSEVVVLDIDEQSLKLLEASYGRFPWPRRIYKDILEFLAIGEPAGIFFDIYFSERTIGSDDDEKLAQATKLLPQVSHAMNFLDLASEDRTTAAPLPKDFTKRFGLQWSAPQNNQGELAVSAQFSEGHNYQDFLVPNPALLESAHRIHVGRFQKDSDGVFRRSPLVFLYRDGRQRGNPGGNSKGSPEGIPSGVPQGIQEGWFPSMTLAGLLSKVQTPILKEVPGELLIYSGAKAGVSVGHEGGATLKGEEPKYRLPVDSQGLTPIHYYRPDRGPETISFAAALSSAVQLQRGQVDDPSRLNVNPLDLKDKVILIGTSAAGLQDLKATPVDPLFPGVKLAATVISNAIQGKFLKAPPLWATVLVTVVLLLLTYGGMFFFSNPALKIVPPLAVLAAWVGLSVYCFQTLEIQIPLAMPGIALLISLIDGLIYNLLIETIEKKRLSATLSKYLSPEVSAKLIEEGINPQAEVGHTQELSILFSDIRGFTTFSETLPPQVVVARLNEYLGQMTEVVFNHRGTLDKFIGDAVMAFWGAPLPLADHAFQAVRTALEMKKAVAQLKANWVANQLPHFDLEVGIGIHTGPVIVGNIGSERRLDYTVIGDNVNLASRIEGATKTYKRSILISQATHEKVQNEILCRRVDAVIVKGKELSVGLFEPLCQVKDKTEPEVRLCSMTEHAWKAYSLGNFSEAMEHYRAIRQEFPDDQLSTIFIERLEFLGKNPPKNWDGVFHLNTK